MSLRTVRLAHSLVTDSHARVGRSVKAMRVHKLGSGKDQHLQFVAFRDNLWVGSWEDLEKASANIIETILAAHPKGEEIKERGFLPDNTCDFVKDYIPDALCGYYDRKTKRAGISFGYSVTSSPLMRKVVEALKARFVEQTDSDVRTRTYKKNQIKGNWDFSRPFYHGTSSEYFYGIVRFGLKSMPHQGNYGEIVHADTVFLTSVWDEAVGHAFHTAGGGKEYVRSRRKNFVPMIVAVTIPDPALVIPDYDVDNASSRGWYEHEHEAQNYYSVGSEKAAKHAGLIGYKGRIPGKFIQALYFYSFHEKVWKRLTPDKFSKAMSRVDNEGDEFWNYIFGYPENERGY